MRQPQGISCHNCGCRLTGARCDVCGYSGTRQAVYPVRHDPLTDAFQRHREPRRVAVR
jgi:hypothetical protein